MSDLISRSELILRLSDYALQEAPNDNESTGEQILSKMIYDTIQNCISCLEEQATAYDIDKVVDELKELKNRYDKNDFAIRGIIEKAIEIVKHGGVGTETKTIRDKAIEWNNHSSKKVPYEFIDFVEGKHEITNDDVCEWKSEDSKDHWKPSCEPNSTYNVYGVSWFRKCPYCGKKIKVVE